MRIDGGPYKNGVRSTSHTWRNIETTSNNWTTVDFCASWCQALSLPDWTSFIFEAWVGQVHEIRSYTVTTSWPNLNDQHFFLSKGWWTLFFWQVIKRHFFMTSEAFAGWILQLRFLRSERWCFVVTLDQWLLESFSASGLASNSRYRAWAQDFNVDVVGEDQEHEVEIKENL